MAAVSVGSGGSGTATGTRQIISVARGTATTDAVNVSQLQGALNQMGGGATVNADGTVSGFSVANTNANRINGTSGAQTTVASALNTIDTALGTTYDIATGVQTTINNINNGAGIKYFHTNSTLADSSATGADAVAIGGAAKSSVATAVALGSNSVADRASGIGGSTMGAVSVGSGGAGVATGTRQIISVARGTQDTDAVNVSQLKGVTNAIGGGSTVNSDGTIKAPTITVGGTTYNDVSSAIQAAATNTDALNWNASANAFDAKHGSSATNKIIDVAAGTLSATSTDAVNGSQLYATNQNVSTNTTDITNIKNGKAGLVQQAAAGANITVAAATDGAAVDFKGTAGARKLINVANGAVNATSTDAVNGSQLYGVSQSTASAIGGGSTVNPDGSISKPSITVNGNTYNTVTDAITGAAGDALNWNAAEGAFSAKHGTSATNKITDVAPGTLSATSTDAVNGAQLYATNQNVTNVTNTVNNINNGGGIKYFHTNSTLADSSATGTDAVAIGGNAKATANNAIALGSNSVADAVNTVSVGSTTAQRKVVNMAAGTADTDAVNVSQLKGVTNVIGGGSTVNSDGTIKAPTINVGGKTYNDVTSAVQAAATVAGNIDALNWNASAGAFDATHAGGTMPNKIINVAAGAVNATSTDAVNGSQLYGVSQSTADAIGGGSTVDPTTGKVTKPSITINGKTYNDMSTAITAASGDALNWNAAENAFSAKHGGASQKITDVTAGTLSANSTDAVNGAQLYATNQAVTDITNNINNGTVGLVQQAAKGANLTVGAATDGAAVDFKGTAGARKLINVANGAVNATSNDAVNGSQLYGVSQSTADAIGGGSTVDPATGKVTKPSITIGGKTYNTITDAITGTAGDALNWDPTLNKFSAAHGSTTSNQIGNVKAGTAALDAVNVSQLQGMANVIGGGTAVDPTTGAITQPTFNITDKDGKVQPTHTVNDALTTIDGRVTNIAGDVTDITNNINNGTIGLVQQAAKGAKLTVGKDTDGDEVDFTNVNGQARKLTSVADGTVAAGSKDAVNGGQLYGVAQSYANVMGGSSTQVNADGTISGWSYDMHNADGSTTNVTNVYDAVDNLDGRVAQNTSDISNLSSIVNNINTGGGIKYFHANSTLADSVASGKDAVAIGGNAQATADNSVALGANAVADRANTVSVGSAGNERQITNVAAGTQDTDAVNVAQLKASGIIDGNGNTKTAVTYDTNPDGSTNVNSITLNGGDGGTVIHNVANGTAATDAVNKGQMDAAISQAAQDAQDPMFTANGDRATEKASATGNHATAMGANANANADNSVALGAGSIADRTNTVSVGSAGHERQITNVAAATADTDAVNYGQYKSGLADTLNQANSYTDSQIQKAESNWANQVNDQFDKVNNKINQVNQQANRGIAAASALINVTPYVPGHTAVNAGVANYRGETALGIGISRWSDNGRVNFNAGVSAAKGDQPVVRVGVGYVF